MTKNRSRWIINVVLIVAVIALAGVSMIPLFGTTFNQNQATRSTPTPTKSVNAPLDAARRSELEQRAKGYELVLQREPDNQTALKGLLEARLELVDIKGTIAPLEKLAQLNPEETNYTVLLAQAKQYTGDVEGAAQVYRQLLAAKPGELNALQGLVDLQLQQNRPEAAVGLLEDTLKTATQANQIKPGSVDTTAVKLILGRVYAEQKRYAEAIAIYDEGIKADQTDFRPLLGKAIVLKTQGKNTEAQPLFDSAAALAPAQYKDQIIQLAKEPSFPSLNPAPTTPEQQSTPAPSPTPSP